METPKGVLWQTVKSQLKCSMMLHFIRVFTVFFRQDWSSEKEIIFLGNYNLRPLSIFIMNHRDLNVSNFMEDSIGLKKVNAFYQKMGLE